jgi:hypothetical protein
MKLSVDPTDLLCRPLEVIVAVPKPELPTFKRITFAPPLNASDPILIAASVAERLI